MHFVLTDHFNVIHGRISCQVAKSHPETVRCIEIAVINQACIPCSGMEDRQILALICQ